MNNTHIAAQARKAALYLSSSALNMDRHAGEILLQCAQALEAVPALDAQGEAPSWHVNFIERGWVNPVVEVRINNKPIGRFHDFGPVREVLPKVLDAALRAWSTPLPHAVGKPLSEDAMLKLWNFAHGEVFTLQSRAMAFGRAVERAHGIVTKETGK